MEPIKFDIELESDGRLGHKVKIGGQDVSTMLSAASLVMSATEPNELTLEFAPSVISYRGRGEVFFEGDVVAKLIHLGWKPPDGV